MSDSQEPERAEAKASKDKLVFELGQRIASIRAEKRMTQAFVANRMKTVRPAPTSLCTANGYDKLTNKNKQIIDYMIKAFLTQQIVESRAVG